MGNFSLKNEEFHVTILSGFAAVIMLPEIFMIVNAIGSHGEMDFSVRSCLNKTLLLNLIWHSLTRIRASYSSCIRDLAAWSLAFASLCKSSFAFQSILSSFKGIPEKVIRRCLRSHSLANQENFKDWKGAPLWVLYSNGTPKVVNNFSSTGCTFSKPQDRIRSTLTHREYSHWFTNQ